MQSYPNINSISKEVYFKQCYEMKLMRRYYFQFRESLMDIEKRHFEDIKISSEDAI
jgi:hypothetical protein